MLLYAACVPLVFRRSWVQRIPADPRICLWNEFLSLGITTCHKGACWVSYV